MSMNERATRVDAACRGAERFHEIAGRLEAEAGEPSAEHPLAPFVLAFYYDYVERDRGERRDEFGP